MPVTIGLIVANLVVFGYYIHLSSFDSLTNANNPVLFNMGASYAPYIFVLHQYWRMFAAMFLHANLVHIAMNMTSLFIFGRLLEKPLGSFRFFILYFVSGMFGALASAGFNQSVESVGASGACLGLFSFYILLQLVSDPKAKGNWSYRLRQMITLGIVIYAANQTPGVDYMCHMGGAVGGIICGFTFIRFSDLRVSFNWKDAVIAAFFGLLTFACFFIETQTVGQNKVLPALILTREALTMIDQQNLSGAALKLDEAKRLAPENIPILLLHAGVIAEVRRIDEALADCNKVLTLDPKNTKAQYIQHAIEDFVARQKQAPSP